MTRIVGVLGTLVGVTLFVLSLASVINGWGWADTAWLPGGFLVAMGIASAAEPTVAPVTPKVADDATWGTATRSRPQPRQHYHGDVLCGCDQPKPCCDQGAVVWPLPCPWHPTEQEVS